MVLEPCNAARISPAASFHVLRHTYASHLVMAGGAIAVAAANLGHSDTRMTEKHYAHLAPNYVADVIRATMPRLGLVEPNSVLSFGLPSGSSRKRRAIYTRKSSEEGLEQEFNSLAAQREVCEAYIHSQRNEGWVLARTRYDDGGFSGGNLQRPALQHLLADIGAGRIDIVVVYKVDRLTRSLADFAQLVEIFDAQSASFVSVTRQFNTTSSMGRLTLNVLLSFAQFEHEVIGERIRDKIAASKKNDPFRRANFPSRDRQAD
jgi:DNA invertase Pin-like site-specific DNA recombinase